MRGEEYAKVGPLRVRVVAALAGISKAKVMTDARAGLVRLLWIRCGTRKMAMIDRDEAARYLQALGADIRST